MEDLKEQEYNIQDTWWKLYPRFEEIAWFDQLIENEYLSIDETDHIINTTLEQILAFSFAQVPYYQHLSRESKLDQSDFKSVQDLEKLPIITRDFLQKNQHLLIANALPQGHEFSNRTKTSGSTGQPVEVLHTQNSLGMFALLKQREFRWFRFDPRKKFAAIRARQDLPRLANKNIVALKETVFRPGWPIVSQYFQTGEFVGCAIANDLEWQLEWLQTHSPAYLLSLSANLEHLALGINDKNLDCSIEGLQAISQTFTPQMRKIVNNAFKVDSQENYGLNEIGIVASRCPEIGNYHVHREHCLVEIVDENGKACKPGKTGKLLVTTLSNLAMPLIRYDTGDMAKAVETCQCGRTLPVFGEIQGRYRRIAHLPKGTWALWGTVQNTLSSMPNRYLTAITRYQLHQFKNNSFELRLESTKPLDTDLVNYISQAWKNACGENSVTLNIIAHENLNKDNKKKFDNFTSEFTPEI